MPSLSCDHCGGPAITSEENIFWEDDGDACESCGFPGHVDVDPTEGSAWWESSEDETATCNDPECDDSQCLEIRGKA